MELSYDDDLFKFSAKLASNMAIAMGREAVIKESGVAGYLHGRYDWDTRIAHCDTSAIRSLRPHLSHTVYIGFGAHSHALVILFGGLQIYVPLPAAKPGAILGFLDPITGEESFEEIQPFGYKPAAKLYPGPSTRSPRVHHATAGGGSKDARCKEATRLVCL